MAAQRQLEADLQAQRLEAESLAEDARQGRAHSPHTFKERPAVQPSLDYLTQSVAARTQPITHTHTSQVTNVS